MRTCPATRGNRYFKACNYVIEKILLLVDGLSSLTSVALPHEFRARKLFFQEHLRIHDPRYTTDLPAAAALFPAAGKKRTASLHLPHLGLIFSQAFSNSRGTAGHCAEKNIVICCNKLYTLLELDILQVLFPSSVKATITRLEPFHQPRSELAACHLQKCGSQGRSGAGPSSP